MGMLIFAIVGAICFMIAYAFGLGGTVSTIIFLAVLTVGAVVRWAEPIVAAMRPDT